MRFGHLLAVDEVDLAVGTGEVVGLLGANGAGKTTLIKMLLGLLRPTGGEVRLFGEPPSMATRRRVGYVSQTLGLYDDLTVEENWAFTAAAFGRVRPAIPESLESSRDELVGVLPLGLQRRVAFAVAVSHLPELLVLDEPTSGVGVRSAERLWEQIRDSAESGAGVLVTTHNMEEAEQCDRLIVMAEGRVAAAGTIDDVVAGRRVVEVRCDDWRSAFGVLDAEGLVVQVRGDVLRVPGTARGIEDLMERQGLRAEVTTAPANLEEAFVDLVRGAT